MDTRGRGAGRGRRTAAELAHRDEHSIEFQVLYLQHRLGARPVKIVPILCGGFSALLDEGITPREDEQVERFVAALREAERTHGGATLYVGAIDLSHVGPRFDPREPKLDERTRAEVEREGPRRARRRASGATPRAGSRPSPGTTTPRASAASRPRTCCCALPSPAPAALLRYQQSDEPDGSMVSTAAMVWP